MAWYKLDEQYIKIKDILNYTPAIIEFFSLSLTTKFVIIMIVQITDSKIPTI